MAHRIKSLLTHVIRGGCSILGPEKGSEFLAYLSDNLVPISTTKTPCGNLLFFSQGVVPHYRAHYFLTKESDTVEWINTFDAADTLWDIGANIGTYSLYAALRGNTVVAFEPLAGNYYLLNKNIELNKMDKKVTAVCIALNDSNTMDYLYIQHPQLGEARNSFEEARGYDGKAYAHAFQQGIVGFTVDDFTHQKNISFPNHIKIDVDGNEPKIIKGARRTLKDGRLKSLLVELYPGRDGDYQDVIRCIEGSGFKLAKKDEGKKGVSNHVFVRQ